MKATESEQVRLDAIKYTELFDEFWRVLVDFSASWSVSQTAVTLLDGIIFHSPGD